MEQPLPFQFPTITIKQVRPLLRRGEKALAHEITAATQKGTLIKFYENKGLDLTDYIDAKMECLLEITRGRLFFKYEGKPQPENTIQFQYQWERRLYEFFPELVKIQEENEGDDTVLEDACVKLFESWGLDGMGIEPFQPKHLFTSAEGSFLVNEYEFEEEIDLLELDEYAYIKIDELYLRGIRPCTAPITPKQKIIIEQPVKKEEPPQPAKKGRSGFFIG